MGRGARGNPLGRKSRCRLAFFRCSRGAGARFPVFGPMLGSCILVLSSLLFPEVACAQGEHSRRVAAELLVLQGDARRLTAPRFSEKQKKGLRDRILGGLAALAILLRLADEEAEAGRTSGADGPRADHAGAVARLRKALDAGDIAELQSLLARLVRAYPLRVPGILPITASPARWARGRRLHERLCAGCHDAPDLDVERPAYNLFAEVRRLSPEELAARLIVGVRGDVVTGVANPLSDEQIAALIVFYRGQQMERAVDE